MGWTGTPFTLWGRNTWPNQDVVGESHYLPAIQAAANGLEQVYEWGYLLPEPDNLYDKNAVAVLVQGQLVGYLPREDAAIYAPPLQALIDKGWLPRTTARVYYRERSPYDDEFDPVGSVTLVLEPSNLIGPANSPPASHHAVLPRGKAIQVTGEDAHRDILAPYVRPNGSCSVYATLHEREIKTARSQKASLEVHVDGKRIGQLTPTMSAALMPVVRHLDENGVETATQAVVKGNSITTEVALYALKSHEIEESWFKEAIAPGIPEKITLRADQSAAAAVSDSERVPQRQISAESQAPKSTSSPAGKMWPFLIGVAVVAILLIAIL